MWAAAWGWELREAFEGESTWARLPSHRGRRGGPRVRVAPGGPHASATVAPVPGLQRVSMRRPCSQGTEISVFLLVLRLELMYCL